MIDSLTSRAISIAVVGILIMPVGGCSTIGNLFGLSMYSSQQRTISNSVEYLYPNNRGEIKIEPRVPELLVPLDVGIAFVPDTCDSFRRHDLNEELKRELLDKVAARFREREIINKVEVIPSHMMKRKGSFPNLRQISEDIGIDVVVLLSYDQVQYTERNFVSAAYHWSIVGRYVFQGDKNDTVTVMDAAVYDIESESLLFHSEATSKVKGNSASAFVVEDLRVRSQQGFKMAIDELSKMLDWDLYKFRQKIKNKEVEVKVTHRGGGSLAVVFLLMFGLVLVLRGKTRSGSCRCSHQSRTDYYP